MHVYKHIGSLYVKFSPPLIKSHDVKDYTAVRLFNYKARTVYTGIFAVIFSVTAIIVTHAEQTNPHKIFSRSPGGIHWREVCD